MAERVRAGELPTLPALDEHAAACTLCRLCRERTQVVVGEGPADADVLVVVDAPGYHDDRTGRLLTGAPGALLDEALELAGRRREEVRLTSVVKCRPPAGRSAFPDEVEACEGWLFRELALVQPRILVTLGSLSLRLVTGRNERLGDVHGTLLHAHVQGRDVGVWPLYHPAAAGQAARLVEELRADARALGRLLRGARSERAVSSDSGATQSAHAPEPVGAVAGVAHQPQLSLDV